MILEIFDVEHGGCALITTSNGRRVMIDCGHNATSGWRPGAALAKAGVGAIDRLYVTNYDEDHASGFEDLTRHVIIRYLFRNGTVSANQLRMLKSEDGMGRGINALAHSIDNTFTGGPPPILDEVDFGDTNISSFCNTYAPPPFGFDDENNLSLVVFITCGQHKVVFPGDMERAGWRQLLADRWFARELSGVTLFVASHHGRENGYCKEVMDRCQNLRAVIISDKKKGYQSQETIDLYRRHARGIIYGGKPRRVLTTRRDSSMQFHLQAQGEWSVSLNLVA